MAKSNVAPLEEPRGGVPVAYDGYLEDAGAGLEGGRAEELVTPFIYILQPLSPQLDKHGAHYIENADEGMFYNTLTKELFDGSRGLEALGIAREYIYTEWNPRDAGGGFRGTRSPDDPVVKALRARQGAFKALRTEEGTDLVEQFNLYVMLGASPLSIENCFPGVIPFKSTSIGVYKGFYSRASAFRYPVKTDQGTRMVTPPLWAHRWRVTSVPMKNDQGRWYNPKFDLVGETPAASLVPASDPLYQEAKRVSEMFRAGQVKVDYETGTSSDRGPDRQPGEDDGDNPPF